MNTAGRIDELCTRIGEPRRASNDSRHYRVAHCPWEDRQHALREAPSGRAPTMGNVDFATCVLTGDLKDDWYRVEEPAGPDGPRQGWMNKTWLAPADP